MDYSIIDIRTVTTDGKGSLSFFEGGHDVPFEIKRVYYIYQTPEGVGRGGHAHRSLTQMLWCPHGSVEVMLDDGRDRETVTLDDPAKGLVVHDLTWREMTWREEGSVLVVAASGYYDESDYIRDYASFVDEVRAGEGAINASAE